jgi:hypothetical protein
MESVIGELTKSFLHMPGGCDGGKDVAEILVHIDMLTKTYDICGRVERSGEE